MTSGAALRDQGHAQLVLSLNGPGEYWSERARAFIENLEPGSLFDADLLHEACGTPPKAGAPGMLIRRAAADGLLERVGYQPSERASRHAAVTSLWRRT